MNTYVNPRRESILDLAKILAEPTTTVGTKRAAVGDLERLVKVEREYLDRPATATECNETMNEVERNKFGFQIQTCVNKVITGRSACDRRAAFDELQTLMYREQWKIERAADRERQLRVEKEEEKKRVVVNDKTITIGEMERLLESFTWDRKHNRDNCIGFTMSGTNQDDRDFSHLFKNFVRGRHGLPNL